MCKQTNTTIRIYCTQLFVHIIKLHSNKRHKNRIVPGYILKPTAYGTTTSGTQPQKNMTTMGKFDTH